MLKKFRHAMPLLAAMSMLAACSTAGSGTSGGPSASPTPSQKPAAQSSVTNTEVKEQTPVTIKFSHWRQEDKEAYAKIYEDFSKLEPHIKIEEEIIPSAEFNQIVQTRLSGGAGPDLFGINGAGPRTVLYNDAGFLEPLDDVAGVGDIQESFKQLTTVDGKLMSVVWNSVNFGLYYNIDLFKQAGVEAPTTWDEFVAVCEALLAKGIQPLTIGGKEAHTLAWTLSYIQVNDQFMKDPDNYGKVERREAKFSELAEFRGSLEKFALLVERGFISKDALGLSYNDSVTAFAQGQAAMVAAGAFTAPTIEAANPNVKFGALPIPGENGEKRTFGVAGMTYGLNKASSDEVKAAAKKFLEYMLHPDVSKEFSEKTALYTTVNGVELTFANQAVTDFANLSQDMFILPAISPQVVDATLNGQIATDLQAIVAGSGTVDSLLATADSKILKP